MNLRTKYLALIFIAFAIGTQILTAKEVNVSNLKEETFENNRIKKNPIIKFALLHLDLKYADLNSNYILLKKAIKIAAKEGAKWIVTPELVLTGYRFDQKIGTDWIHPGTDKWVKGLQNLTSALKINLFLSHLEKDPKNNHIYNTLFVINTKGNILTRHHKINTIPISEAWSTPGSSAQIIELEGHKVGLLICADAWPKKHAAELKIKGAELIISTANWAPGKYGPKDTWESRSQETGLPLFVANRTGIEGKFDLTKAQSVVVSRGNRLITHTSKTSSILIFNWNQKTQKIISKKVLYIEN